MVGTPLTHFTLFFIQKGDSPGMFRGLEEMLEVEEFPGYQNLYRILENCLDMVCEVRGEQA
jgi:hypothetical protein